MPIWEESTRISSQSIKSSSLIYPNKYKNCFKLKELPKIMIPNNSKGLSISIANKNMDWKMSSDNHSKGFYDQNQEKGGLKNRSLAIETHKICLSNSKTTRNSIFWRNPSFKNRWIVIYKKRTIKSSSKTNTQVPTWKHTLNSEKNFWT